ncbi:phosphotransferase family protein [Pseudomonas putida]|uniref:phosphotransferase family protein n=1 Tax=Pseudomonas putida TaxID=303 RepID=UPI0023632FBB|nr:phosphotransferase family protein [Pseudomonas putida]MDD2068692.1 phosphotransferase family protein [Pseudomonas putida]HDS1738625.1 phosphotransferase family protein [Pseudomonas putida]
MAGVEPVFDGSVAVRPSQLSAWMDAHGLEAGELCDFERLTGGTQNLIVRFRRGERSFVLRRPPLHPRPDGDKTILREARVLGALAKSGVPHPGLIAACGDTSVIGSAFYLMEPVEGFNPSGRPLKASHADNPEWRRRMGFAMVDALLALGEVIPENVGLEGFGKPQTFLERQVPRWRAHLEACPASERWFGPSGLIGLDDLGQQLENSRPDTFLPGVLHGDFHLANVMFRNDSPELAAVIDWELATLGDPLLDLGWLVATWPDPTGHGAGTIHVQPWDGFPTADELVQHYANGSHRDLSHIDWYIALANYKLAIMLEASHARACAGRASLEIGDKHHASALQLVQNGLSRLASRR